LFYKDNKYIWIYKIILCSFFLFVHVPWTLRIYEHLKILATLPN
jgi:hypothetical protein